MRKLNPDIFFTYWCHKIEPSSLPWILNTVRAKKKIEDSKYPDTCVWTGRFDLNPDTCGRGNFCILKEKVVDSKKNRIRVDGALIGTPLGVSKFDFSDNFCCLPFTWANRWVDGLGKWYVKFMAGKIRPRIAFTICTNQFHTPRNDSEGLKLVPKMALKKWNTNFLLENSLREKGLPFQKFHCFRKFYTWNDTKSPVPFTFQPGFPETFSKW